VAPARAVPDRTTGSGGFNRRDTGNRLAGSGQEQLKLLECHVEYFAEFREATIRNVAPVGKMIRPPIVVLAPVKSAARLLGSHCGFFQEMLQ